MGSIPIYIPVLALMIAPVVMLFIQNKTGLPNSIFITSGTGILFLFSLGALLFLFRKDLYKAINYAASGILLTLFVSAFALPQFNPSIGFSAMARKASDIYIDEKIDNYYFYRFRGGENMDVYLREEPSKITREDSLFSTHARGNNLIFLKENDIVRSQAIADWLKEVHYEKVGIFYFVHPSRPNQLVTRVKGL